MDTSILGPLFMIAPDLMQEVELRALVLERVAALGPIGRRALAQRLHLAEREVRSAADALKDAGCILQSAAGMELTDYGRELIDTARSVSRGRRSLSALELALTRKLKVARVCVVHGDADMDESVLEEVGRAAAQQLRFLLQDAQVVAVSGGRTLAAVAETIASAAPMDITVVPAQGGMLSPAGTQANTLAEAFAVKLGGAYRMIHVPDGTPPSVAEDLLRMPQMREAAELLRSADVLLYGIGRAGETARRRAMNALEREMLTRQGAVGEALGMYFGAEGVVGGARNAVGLRAQDLGYRHQAAAVAAGHSKAEAIIAVCMHHPHKLLVTDEGAALRMTELLRI